MVRRDEEGLIAASEPAPQAIAERLLALVTLAPHSERVVRRAWRSAQRLDAELDVLLVRPPDHPPSSQDRQRLEALRRLVSMLGARLHVEEGEDVASVAINLARDIGATYVLMGAPAPRRGFGRLGGSISGQSLLARLLAGLPGVDIRLVSDPGLRRASAGPEESASSAGVRGDGDEP